MASSARRMGFTPSCGSTTAAAPSCAVVLCAGVAVVCGRRPFVRTAPRSPPLRHAERTAGAPRPAPTTVQPPSALYGGGEGGPGQGKGDVSSRVADVLLRAGRFLQSANGQVALWVGLVWLVLTGRIGFIFDSFLFIFIFISVVPVLGLFAFRWWVSMQVVKGSCPNCGAAVTGLRNQPFQCMKCGQQVSGDESGFSWDAEPSNATIDIDAKSIDVD